jgi:hypothetical protein
MWLRRKIPKGTSEPVVNLIAAMRADPDIPHHFPSTKSLREYVRVTSKGNAVAVAASDRGRLRATNLELARLDELLGKFRAKALEGCPVSANLLVRLSERRSALLGLDHRQIDPVMLSLSVNPQPSSTTRILQALEQFRAAPTNGSGEDVNAPARLE